MRLGVLFSGGKDSCYALELASEEHEISCLITVNSDNKDSYMFHTPAIEWTKFQAESIGIPHLFGRTPGVEGLFPWELLDQDILSALIES